MFFDRLGSSDALDFPGAVLQNDKGCFPENPHAAHPTAENNFLLHKIRKGLDKYALTGCGHPAKPSSQGGLLLEPGMRRCHPASG